MAHLPNLSDFLLLGCLEKCIHVNKPIIAVPAIQPKIPSLEKKKQKKKNTESLMMSQTMSCIHYKRTSVANTQTTCRKGLILLAF